MTNTRLGIALESGTMQELFDRDDTPSEPDVDLTGVTTEDFLDLLRQISRVEPLDSLLSRIATMIERRFAIRALTICVLDERSGYFRPMVVRGFPEDQRRAIERHAYTLERKQDELHEKFRVDHNCYYVRAEGLTQVYNDDVDYIQDISELKRPRESVEEWHDLDYIDFVMTDRLGNWIGWIEVDEPAERKAPSRETIQGIHVLTDLAAIAIENSKIYGDAIDAVNRSQGYLDLIVHDLGNIIDPMAFYLEKLSDGSGPDHDLAKDLRNATALASDAKRLIANVRRVTEMRSSDATPRERHDLREVMVRCISSVKRDFPTKDIVVSLDCPHGRCDVVADEFVTDLFLNVLGNAVKHTPGNVAEVDVSISKGHDAWIARVEDRGIGIPDDRKERIFDRFCSRSAEVGGSGLGLSIVKALVEKYGGVISVKDRVPGDRSKGTCFEIALPMAPETDAE